MVIIAIVIVIALVVVGLMINQTSSASTVSANSVQLGLMTGQMGVSEAVAGEDGNALLVVQNNTGDSISVSKVVVDGVDHVFGSGGSLGMGGKVSLDLNGIVACSGSTKKNYSVKIVYVSSSGLEKTIDLGNIALDCVEKITPTGNFVKEGGEDEEEGGGEELESIPYYASCWDDEADPHAICNCQDLNQVRDYLDWDYILKENINFDVPECSDFTSGAGFEPIGTDDGFSGVLDGNGKVITNFYINDSEGNLEYVGLFGWISETGIVSNLGMTDAFVSSTFDGPHSGILTAYNDGTILNSYSTGQIYGYDAYLGGLAGYNDDIGDIKNSHSSATITGDDYSYAGGLVGDNYGIISDSYATGNVSGTNNDYDEIVLGGLVGYGDEGVITNSYATGNISFVNNYGADLYEYLGGLVGKDTQCSVENSFSTGQISVSGTQADHEYFGGLIGYTEGAISNSYWFDWPDDDATTCYSGGDDDCTKIDSGNGDLEHFYDSSNDPLNNWTWGADNNWTAREGDYPILTWQEE